MSFIDQADLFPEADIYDPSYTPEVKPIPGQEKDKKGRPYSVTLIYGKHWVEYSMDRSYRPWRFVATGSSDFDPEDDVPSGTIEKMRNIAKSLLLAPKTEADPKAELEKAGQIPLL